MKRVGYLFESAFTEKALMSAYKRAAKGKTYKRACFEFTKHLTSNLDSLLRSLLDGTYRPRPYHTFMVYEPKPRVIHAPAFADLVVQHAVYAVIYPLFNKGFIDQSYACRPGKGTHAAANYAQAALRKSRPDSYSLKLDIRKFFYSIDRARLRTMLGKRVKDARFLDIMMLFTEHDQPTGIPIGNLLSQLYALVYLDSLDHFVKRDLGVRLYCRYVDDFILFDLDYEQAKSYLGKIQGFLRDNLGLALSKSTIAKRSRGVNFVGYRTWVRTRFIRKHSLFKFTRSAKRGKIESVVSILGHARNTASLSGLLKKLNKDYHGLYCQLPKVYR